MVILFACPPLLWRACPPNVVLFGGSYRLGRLLGGGTEKRPPYPPLKLQLVLYILKLLLRRDTRPTQNSRFRNLFYSALYFTLGQGYENMISLIQA